MKSMPKMKALLAAAIVAALTLGVAGAGWAMDGVEAIKNDAKAKECLKNTFGEKAGLTPECQEHIKGLKAQVEQKEGLNFWCDVVVRGWCDTAYQICMQSVQHDSCDGEYTLCFEHGGCKAPKQAKE